MSHNSVLIRSLLYTTGINPGWSHLIVPGPVPRPRDTAVNSTRSLSSKHIFYLGETDIMKTKTYYFKNYYE